MIKHFAENILGRDFVVGDIHGCASDFDAMLPRIGFDRFVDRMFSVGDLIDRGHDSMGALALLSEPWFYSVRGNHEEILLTVQRERGSRNWDWWCQNGGQWALSITPAELADYASAIEVLPLAITVGDGASRFNVIHAEFFGNDAMLDAGDFSDHTKEVLMWGRSLIKGHGSEYQVGLSPTYCGHTITEEIQKHGQQIYIDTGAFIAHFWEGESLKNALTIIEPKTGQFWRSTEVE